MALVLPPVLLLPPEIAVPLLPAIPAVWLAGRAAGGRAPPRSPLDLPLAAIVGMTLVSCLVTFDLAVSLPSVVGVVAGIATYYATVRAGRSWRGWWGAYAVFLGAGAGVALLGALGTDWHLLSGKMALLSPITERIPTVVTGLAGTEGGLHPNTVAGLLLLCLPSVGAAAALLWRHRRVLAWRLGRAPAAAVVAGAALGALTVGLLFVLLQSRTAYGALLATAVLLGLARPGAGATRSRRILAGAASAAAGAVLLAAALVGAGADGGRDASAAGPTDGGPLSVRTLEARVEIWRRGLAFVAERPLTGIGMNTFSHLVHRRHPFPPGPAGRLPVPADEEIGHAHNVVLQAALDLGLLGAAAVLALYGVTLLVGWRAWRLALSARGGPAAPAPPPPDDVVLPTILAALLAGLFAHALFGLFDAVPVGSRKGIPFWLLLGLLTALPARERAGP